MPKALLVRNLLLTCLLLIAQQAMAQTRQRESSAFQMNLGVVYSGNISYRGALVWDAPIAVIGPSFVFFDAISLGAGGLSVFKRFGDYHKLAIGLNTFNDDEPNFPAIRLKSSSEDYKNQRAETFGTYLKYDFRVRQFVAISLSYQKDLKRHEGNIIGARVSTSIIPFVTVGLDGDYADGKANRYAYGLEAISGVGHLTKFVSIMLPILPWQGRLITSFNHSKILKNTNAQADYVRGDQTNSNLSFIANWRL